MNKHSVKNWNLNLYETVNYNIIRVYTYQVFEIATAVFINQNHFQTCYFKTITKMPKAKEQHVLVVKIELKTRSF